MVPSVQAVPSSVRGPVTTRKKTDPAKREHRWRISLIKSTPAAELGTVSAPDAESAIAKAIEEWGITEPHRHRRLMARRVS